LGKGREKTFSPDGKKTYLEVFCRNIFLKAVSFHHAQKNKGGHKLIWGGGGGNIWVPLGHPILGPRGGEALPGGTLAG